MPWSPPSGWDSGVAAASTIPVWPVYAKQTMSPCRRRQQTEAREKESRVRPDSSILFLAVCMPSWTMALPMKAIPMEVLAGELRAMLVVEQQIPILLPMTRMPEAAVGVMGILADL